MKNLSRYQRFIRRYKTPELLNAYMKIIMVFLPIYIILAILAAKTDTLTPYTFMFIFTAGYLPLLSAHPVIIFIVRPGKPKWVYIRVFIIFLMLALTFYFREFLKYLSGAEVNSTFGVGFGLIAYILGAYSIGLTAILLWLKPLSKKFWKYMDIFSLVLALCAIFSTALSYSNETSIKITSATFILGCVWIVIRLLKWTYEFFEV